MKAIELQKRKCYYNFLLRQRRGHFSALALFIYQARESSRRVYVRARLLLPLIRCIVRSISDPDVSIPR